MVGQGTRFGLFSFVAAITLLFVGCDDNLINHAPTPEFDSDRFLSVIDNLTEDDVVAIAMGEAVPANEGRMVSLGDEHLAHVWRPGFVEAWVMVTAWDADPDPDCKGSGIGFVKCVRRHVDDGEEYTVHKVGNEYHAHLRGIPFRWLDALTVRPL